MFNQYPYLNLNDLNLDYILRAIKEMRYEVTNFVSINAIKYADPIQWNITSQYEKNTIVIDPVTGTAYISVAPVPAGVALTRPEYWTVVFDLGSFVTRAAQNFTNRWESDTTTTATFATPAGGWLVWGDVLYKALVNITAGDTYVVGSNIEHFTMEELIATITQAITNEVQARQDADTALSGRIDDEVQARQDADTALQNAIDAIKATNIPVNILDCGITGDGSDESATLQTILDGTYGRYIVIPAGVEIHVYSGVTIGTNPILLEGVSNLSSKIIGHGNIDILTATTNGAIIKNVGFDYYGGWNTATSGTQLKIVAREGFVDNCAFYHYVRAISIDNAIDYKITNCYFAEGNAVQAGIYAHAIIIGSSAYCTGVHISNCTILSDDANSAYSGITIRYADGIDINNVLCNRCQYGVILQPTTGVVVHGVVFTNCLFDQCQILSVDIAPTNGRVQNVRFANCWLTTNDTANGTCIAIRPASTATAQFISFLNCSIQSAATGILTAGVNISDIVINGNTFTEIKGNVLLLNVGTRYNITNNIIDLNVEDGADSYVNGFNIDGIDYLVLVNNISLNATNSDCIVANVAHFKYWQNFFNISNLYDNEQCAGTTAERPVVKYVGMPYYDTTLAMPIWWNGSDWIDAAGNVQT